MHPVGYVCVTTVVLTGILPALCSAQRLLFKSGFENATVLQPIPGGLTGPNGYLQQLTGADNTTGFSWPLNAGFNPQYSGLYLEPYNSDPLSSHFLNSIQTVTGHTGASTNALLLDMEAYPSPSCCAQEVLKTSGMATPLKEVYYRFWEKLPSSLGAFLSTNTSFYWRLATEYKTSNDYRIHLDFNTTNSYNALHPHMHADAGGINASNGSSTACPYRDPITGAITYNCSADYHDFVNIDNNAISIPVNQWFLVELYFKRSVGPDGRFFAAINGQTVGDTMQPDYGVDFEDIRDMYWVNLYNSLVNGSEWIDDLEIWDTPPCGMPPCGSGTSTTYTGPVPPFITSRAAAVGEVGMPFSFKVTATGNPTSYYVSGSLPAGLSIDHMTGLISGTPTSAGTTKCYIDATNSVGKGAQWLEFQISNAPTTPPTISSFSASSSTINAGEWVQLTWTQNGAASLSIDQGIGDVTGADPFPVLPNATTTYTLTATNAAGVVKASAIVNVTNGTTGSIQQIQANDNQGNSVTSVSAPFPSANTAGNMILTFVRASTTTQTVTVTDSVGNSYTHAVAQNQTADGHQIHFFYAKNVKAGNNTVTATFSATNNHPYIAVYEYSGLNTSSPLDQIASAQGSSASPSCGPTPRTTSANELAVSGLGMTNNFTGTVTAGSGWTMLTQDTSTSRAANESENLSANGTITAPFTLSASTKWSCILATFKP